MGCCACYAGSGWAEGGGGAGISGACCPASAILYLCLLALLHYVVLHSI